MEKQLIEEIPDGVATLTFNRPDRLNAFSTPSMEGLLEALPRLARDAAVGVIVPAWWGVAQGPYDVARRRASCAPLSWASTNSARRPRTNAHLTLLPFELILGRTSLKRQRCRRALNRRDDLNVIGEGARAPFPKCGSADRCCAVSAGLGAGNEAGKGGQ
jgi:hypothetical protein